MVTNNFLRRVEKEYERMERSLSEIDQQQEDRLVTAEQCLMLIDGHVRKLKAQVIRHQFDSMADEVCFFRDLKPKFISKYLYYNQILEIESLRPRSGKKAIKKFYENRMAKLNEDYLGYIEFYNYFKRGATYLDQKYFVRNAYDLKMRLPDHLYSFDDGFTTFYDHQVAKIIANDDMINFLMARLKALEIGEEQQTIPKNTLKWTAPKVALIELIYALHHCRCFNAGTLDLSETTKVFEQLLEVDLHNFHKVIAEIKARKSNRTKFLQHLQQNLEQLFLDTDF
ncbi:RteC domain-containing protein [Chryseobacterium sp. FH1]|uniref:RteC domain-containing protein n=1 Tax=Chryseobacterium sp. FH1 TaxID=1233951 RepID=UPI0004E3FCFE|nr:RteC domain-containing protein [Chryseobacterium sp. FH1]KFC19328.1 hypothetical protein IO90_08445 [Chryseobacterium sp. FH1]